MRTEPIRDRQAAIGLRVRLTADLDGARISLQVDIGFDDVVTPGVVQADFPTLLDFPAPRSQANSRETVVAEKNLNGATMPQSVPDVGGHRFPRVRLPRRNAWK